MLGGGGQGQPGRGDAVQDPAKRALPLPLGVVHAQQGQQRGAGRQPGAVGLHRIDRRMQHAHARDLAAHAAGVEAPAARQLGMEVDVCWLVKAALLGQDLAEQKHVARPQLPVGRARDGRDQGAGAVRIHGKKIKREGIGWGQGAAGA